MLKNIFEILIIARNKLSLQKRQLWKRGNYSVTCTTTSRITKAMCAAYMSNNCATAVAKSLKKAGIITYMGNNNPIWTIKLNSYIPSRLFNDIVKHNSNGTYIYK